MDNSTIGALSRAPDAVMTAPASTILSTRSAASSGFSIIAPFWPRGIRLPFSV